MTALARKKDSSLESLLAEIRACRICEKFIQPNPVLHVSVTAKLCIASQAPGLRAHETGLSFNDRSGDRLREWMGVDRETFYDKSKVSIAAMAFCFPGYDAHGGDRPPRRECNAHWRQKLFDARLPFDLTLLVGNYAQSWHLGKRAKSNMTDSVKAWREYAPLYIPLPHPSWRNNGWLKKNPWFERELIPYLCSRVKRVLSR